VFDALGLPEGIAQATTPDPARRLVTAGHAVQAMGLTGLGFVTHQRSLGPHVFPPKPLARRIAPGLPARHRTDATRGRALATLSA